MYQPMSIVTPEARLRCAAHTLAEQLAQLREIERKRVIAESCERIMRDNKELRERLVMPLDGAQTDEKQLPVLRTIHSVPTVRHQTWCSRGTRHSALGFLVWRIKRWCDDMRPIP